jgi:hypothetical protein
MDVPTFAPTPEALSRALAGVPVEGLPGGYALAAPPLTAPHYPATDARNRWNFPRATFLYAPRQTRRGSGLHLTVVLHYDDPDLETASRVGRLCGRLLRLHRERFGKDAPFPRMNDTADVWLTRNRPVGAGGVHLGGETWNHQVYVYSVGDPDRTSLEWTRTLAHEWGHLTLVGARGYREPEGDAAGFLGERLHLRWLLEDARKVARRPAANATAPDGVNVADLETYHQRQIAPLLARFATGGPFSRALDGDRAENMDYYVASALAFESAVGPELLGRALYEINGVAPRDLIRAMVAVVDREATLTVRLPAWVPLTRTRYRVTADRPGQIALADRPPLAVKPETPTGLDLRLSGWKRVRGVSGGIQTVTFERQ